MEIESGFFFISDITGYTRFLTQSELGHAKEILDAIFDSILENVEAPLAVSKVEGDAIFCYVPDRLLKQPQSMLNAMEATYFEFRRQLKLMDINTTCECNACVNMKDLDLKVFIHHGEYILHDVAGSTELAGADVILVHRLMKNTVTEATGFTGYGLVSQAALEAIGTTGGAEQMAEHREHYEDFGDVTVYLTDLNAAWEAAADRRRQLVARDEAVAYSKVSIPVTPWIAWAYATDGEVKKRMYGVETHERTDGAVKLGIGASFHCKHQLGDVDYLVVDIDAPRYYTNANQSGPIRTMTTVQFAPVKGGVEVEILTSLAEGNRDDLAGRLQAATDLSANTLRDIITADLEAGVISKDRIAETEAGKQIALRPEVAEGRFADLRRRTAGP